VVQMLEPDKRLVAMAAAAARSRSSSWACRCVEAYVLEAFVCACNSPHVVCDDQDQRLPVQYLVQCFEVPRSADTASDAGGQYHGAAARG
jgi:hypothetical protein